jgi:predicted HTH domain antitoxin
MTTLSIQVSDKLFAVLHKSPVELTQEIQLIAAAKWYDMGQISQEKAAEFAGLSREAFMLEISRLGVSPFQYTEESLARELADAD